MANKILKGGISNYIYRWDTNAGACDSCQELNNTIYNSENDIPSTGNRFPITSST